VQVPAPAGNMSLSRQHSVALQAPAKLNLSLVVQGPRDDGYHDLHSVMATLALYDHLRLTHTAQPGIDLHTSGLDVPNDPNNLVVQAALALARDAAIEPALRIDLHKNIPLGGGLGGGSSDAAACLIGLNRLWQLQYSRTQLASIAAQIGSDVSFFLYAPVALCTGRGDIVTPLSLRCRLHVLLIMPALHVPTPQVYKQFQHNPQKADHLLHQVEGFLQHDDLDGLAAQQINNLAPACLELFAPLRKLRSELRNLDIPPVQVSGSGATLFLTSPSHDQIKQWAQLVQERQLGQAQCVSFHNQSEPFLEVHHADF